MKTTGLLTLALALGCNGMGAGENQEGLTIFSQDAEGLTGMYQQGERSVFFEAVRTGIYENRDEAKTVVEYSARFADADGRSIVAIHQGHGPDAWNEPTHMALADLVMPALDAFATADLGQAAVEPREWLLRLRPEAEELAGAQRSAPRKDVGASYSVWQQRVKIFRRCMGGIADWLCPGTWHTGTKQWRYKDGVAQASYSHCNHGSSGWCPGDQYMTMYCDKYGPQVATEGELAPIGLKCTTSYSWNSGGSGELGWHNCNDDSHAQARAAAKNVANYATGKCSDTNTNNNSPNCADY